MSHQGSGGVEDDAFSSTSAYRLLSHVYRRALVDCLEQFEAGIAMADAAAEVAARTVDRTVRHPTAGEVERVYAALYHSHLPRLVDAGVVAHDRERNVVSLSERGRRLADVQDRLAELGTDETARSVG